jgi:predicted RecA/RadA family phage recombinase
MSTNQVQPGKSVLVTAGGTVASGSVQEVGSDFIGVALGAATNGTDYQLALEGVFNIAQKTSETWSQGDKIYWDSSAATASKTYAAGAADAFIGVATAAVAANAGTGPVKLRGGAEAEVDLDDVVLKSLYDANTHPGRDRRQHA